MSLVGVVGSDAAAARLRGELAAAGIGAEGLVDDPGRPTVEKVRIVTDRNQQVARVDYESDAEHRRRGRAAIDRSDRPRGTATRRCCWSRTISKGTVTQGGDATRCCRSRATGTPLLVDPKIPHLDCYAGASLVTPNHQEAEAATHRRIRSDEEARSAALDFRARARCEAVLITRGEAGMWLSSDETEGAVPAIAREVADVTGAGDTVVATLALALAAGATIVEAAGLANHAAGVVVGKFGPATVTRTN